jgi:hypothetical protein
VYNDRKAAVVSLFGESTFLDELGFLVGVLMSIFFTAVCFGAPRYLGLAYVVFIVPLLFVRFLLYRRQKWVSVNGDFGCFFYCSSEAFLYARFLLLHDFAAVGVALARFSQRRPCVSCFCSRNGLAFFFCSVLYWGWKIYRK